MSASRRSVYHNDGWQRWTADKSPNLDQVRHFHRSLPNYKPTPLLKLEDLAHEIGVRAIYLKDEGSRFDLPSFKILGASWGAFRAIACHLDLPLTSELDDLKNALKNTQITLHAATDGNHGRAVARMGRWLDVPVNIRVPSGMHASTIKLIESEGAKVIVSDGSYDDAVLEAQAASHEHDGLLIQDFAFGDYQAIPQWIVDGYSTMMSEIDEQLGGQRATHVFAPVGVGSFAQAVTSYVRRQGSNTGVIGVEPDVAACLRESLDHGHPTAIKTSATIMAGLECGTVSTTAWPVLSRGLQASMTVSDYEAHEASSYLGMQGISAGPCGGSTIAALRRLSSEDKKRLGMTLESIIVLPCTEGAREYDIPPQL